VLGFTTCAQRIEPIMAEAVVRRMDWAANLGLKSQFGSEGPTTYQDRRNALGKSIAAD